MRTPGRIALLVALTVPAWAIGCSESEPTPQPAAPTAPAAAAEAIIPVPGQVWMLDRLDSAERDIAYTGTKLATHGEPRKSRETRMRVARYRRGDRVLEWGEGESAASWCYSERPIWLRDRDLLIANYRIELDPQPGRRVAGRPTRHITVAGMHEGRPRLDLLVDAETWVVLEERHESPTGAPLLVSTFEEIRYGEPGEAPPRSEAERLEALAVDGAQAPAEQEAVRPDGWAPLALARAPDGFRRVARKMLSCGSLGEYWSDGLAAFSLQQRPAPEDDGEPPDGYSCGEKRGHTWVSSVIDGVSVRVIGNLTQAELESILRGLRSIP